MRLRAALVQAAAALAATAAAQVPAGCIADRNYDRSVTVLDLLLVQSMQCTYNLSIILKVTRHVHLLLLSYVHARGQQG